MRTLLVFRHATARRAPAGEDDHERPLSGLGERDASRMGRRLREEGLVPDLVLSSTAVRALSTARLAAGAGGFPEALEAHGELYGAAPGDCLELVRRRGGDHERVMIVGHNPGFQHLVRAAGEGGEAMPTGAVGVVAVDAATWEGLEPAACHLVRVLTPRGAR